MIDVKAFFKSMNTPTEAFLLLIALVISSVISNKSKDVVLFFRKLYWLSLSILFCSMNLSNLLSKSFSKMFENSDNRGIGL